MVSVRGYTRKDGTRVKPHSRRGSGAATVGGLVLLGVLWNVAGKPMPQLDLPRAEGDTTAATVTRVIDGDTIAARDDEGRDLGRVRILGMDAPELARDGKQAMCGAEEAKDEAARLLDGQDIELVTDTGQPDRDDYGRLLRYVDINTDDGTLDVTEELIRSGHAPNTSRDQSHDRHKAYVSAEDKAQDESRGLWSSCR